MDKTHLLALSESINQNLRKSGFLAEAEQYLECLHTELNKVPLRHKIVGDTPPEMVNTAIKQALLNTSEWSKSRGKDPMVVWNPTTAALFEDRVALSKVASSSSDKSKLSPKVKVKEKRQEVDKPKPRKQCVTTEPVVTDDDQLQRIAQELTTWAGKDHPYRLHHRYIKCTVKECSFCYQVFTSINLTRCSDRQHTNCTPCGWFPHVGKTLWSTYTKRHSAGKSYITKEYPVLDGQLPSIRAIQQTTPVAMRGVKRRCSPSVQSASPKYNPQSPQLPPPELDPELYPQGVIPPVIDESDWNRLVDQEARDIGALSVTDTCASTSGQQME